MSDTSKDGLLALCGSFTGLGTIAVCLRFYARKQQKLPLLADDWTALIAAVTYVGVSTIIFLTVHEKFLGYSSSSSKGGGSSILKTVGKLEVAFDVIITSCLGWVRLSAVLLIRRIFYTKVGKEWINPFTMITAVIIALCYTAWALMALFQCRTDFAAFWNGEYAKVCTLNISWSLGFAIGDIILDVWVLLLPIPRIWSLQIRLAKKLATIGVFLLAFVGLGASIARLVIFVQYQHKFAGSYDQQREQTKLAYIQMLEAGISVTAVNLPALWLLFSSTIPRKFGDGLQSLQVLLSSASRSNYNASVSTAETNHDTAGYSEITVNGSVMNSNMGQHFNPMYDIKNPGTEAYAMRNLDGEQTVGFTRPAAGIRVDKGVEVKQMY